MSLFLDTIRSSHKTWVFRLRLSRKLGIFIEGKRKQSKLSRARWDWC